MLSQLKNLSWTQHKHKHSVLRYLKQTKMTTTLSFSLKFFFTPTTPTSFLQPHTVTFSPRKTTVKTACFSSQNPHQHQKQQKKNQSNANTNDSVSSEGEKGFDAAGFLAKRGISHKQFAQFLRER